MTASRSAAPHAPLLHPLFFRRRRATSPVGRAAAAALLVVLGGCQFGGAGAGAGDRQAVAACKADADRTYLQQNRVLLSERSQRDTPFSSSGTVGVTSAGLPQLYGRSSDVEACLRRRQASAAAAQPDANGATSPQTDALPQP